MQESRMKVTLLKYPTEKDWIEVKRRALITREYFICGCEKGMTPEECEEEA